MKKSILFLLMALVLCISMVAPASAATSTLESLIVKSDLDYDYIRLLEEGFIMTRTDTDGDGYRETYVLLDSTGNEIKTPAGYEIVPGDITVSEGMAIVRQAANDGSGTESFKYGFMDTSGKLVVPAKYDQVSIFSEGLAAVYETHTFQDDNFIPGWTVTRSTSKIGFIDKTGNLVIPMNYEDVYSNTMIEDIGGTRTSLNKPGFSEGLISVKKDEKWGVIDKQGNTVIPFHYDSPIGSFHNGLATFVKNGKYGFIDQSGKVIVPAAYDLVKNFSEGYAVVANYDRTNRDGEMVYGAINTQGTLVVPMKYHYMTDFHEGMACVSEAPYMTGKLGYVNTSGTLVVPLQYIEAYPFSNGLAVVAVNDERFSAPTIQFRYGYINKQGTVVIPLEYSNAHSFSDGIAVASLNVPDHIGDNSSAPFDGEPKYIYFNTNGNEVLSHGKEYGEIEFSGEFGVARQANGKRAIFKNPCYERNSTPAVLGNFTDVSATAYYADSVSWAVEKNITSGTSATTFRPNRTCTTAQILTFLWRANGSPKPTIENPFSDVASDEYYTEAALWAYENGLISGNTFGGNVPCTRSMVVTYLWKLAGQPDSGTSDFSDVPQNADCAQAVTWAVGKSITSGTGNNMFSPDTICSRGEIVTFLYRAFSN